MKLLWLPVLFALTTTTVFAADFPQCNEGKYTSSAKEVKAMLSNVLGFNASRILEDEPYSGQRAQVTLITSGDTFQFRSQSRFDITAPAKVCQKSDKALVAVLDSSRAQVPALAKSFMKSSYTLTISEVSKSKIRISESGGMLNNTFSAQ